MAAGLGHLPPPADPPRALVRRGKAGTLCPLGKCSGLRGAGAVPAFAGLVRLLQTRTRASPNPAAPLRGSPATSTNALWLVKLELHGRGLRCVPAADPTVLAVGTSRCVNAGHCRAGHPEAVPSCFPAHEWPWLRAYLVSLPSMPSFPLPEDARKALSVRRQSAVPARGCVSGGVLRPGKSRGCAAALQPSAGSRLCCARVSAAGDTR